MTITELSNDMKKYCGGSSFITRKELAGFLGKRDPQFADQFLCGLSRIGKAYFIPDVAKQLKASCVIQR